MANLNQVGIVREEYRDLLRSEVGVEGPTLDEEAAQGASKRYGEDAIINLCMALETTLGPWEQGSKLEMTKDEVLRDALAILDQLDTLGMEVRHKQ